jgi:hypothetical protein
LPIKLVRRPELLALMSVLSAMAPASDNLARAARRFLTMIDPRARGAHPLQRGLPSLAGRAASERPFLRRCAGRHAARRPFADDLCDPAITASVGWCLFWRLVSLLNAIDYRPIASQGQRLQDNESAEVAMVGVMLSSLAQILQESRRHKARSPDHQ